MLDLFSTTGSAPATLPIRSLGPDEMISEPGFYQMPIERHHGQPCIGPSVTSSILRTIETGSPADVWAFHALNPDRYEREDRRALILGQAMASFIEGGRAEFDCRFQVLPEDKPTKPTAAQIAAIEAGKGTEAGMRSFLFWRGVWDDPREALTADEAKLIFDMGKVVRTDPAAQAVLGGIPEITMAWFDEPSQLWCLSRPDQLSMSGMLSDYKKVNCGGRPFTGQVVDSKITSYRYDMQMSLAVEGFAKLTGFWTETVGLIFQADEPPYSVILRAIDPATIKKAQFCNHDARMTFRECLDSGIWPGPGENIGTYRQPDWLSERILDRMATKGVSA